MKSWKLLYFLPLKNTGNIQFSIHVGAAILLKMLQNELEYMRRPGILGKVQDV